MSELIKRKDGSYSRRGLWDNIRANRGSGRKPTEEMLRQEKKIKNLGDGGSIPERYRNMGFTRVGQKKEGDGQKKWKVLAKKGSKYKIVQGGYRGMKDFSQHHSEKRRSNFWNRMGGKNSAKANDPFSPLYWHKRLGKWEDGGQLPQYQDGGWFDTVIKNLNPFNWFGGDESYNEAFSKARKEGLDKFTWNGKEYTTQLAGEKPKPLADTQSAKPIVQADDLREGWQRFPEEILLWQAHKESGGFQPNVISGKIVSPANAKGLTQIRPIAKQEYHRLTKTPESSIDLTNSKDAVKVQRYLMNEHYNSPAATTGNPTDLVRQAKALAFYNYGRAATINLLNQAKKEGHDIYKSMSWVESLPLETKDYIKKVLLHKNPTYNKTFHKDTVGSPYNKLYDFQQGGVITDPRGQWAHPGKVTRIPGNNITMAGVNRPLLGISDKGQAIVMKPGKNYKFTGAKHVTEYPL